MLPREITRGSMRGAPCVCEVVVELYRIYMLMREELLHSV